jgi:hypothetical protein
MGNPIEMDDLGVLPHFRKHQFFFLGKNGTDAWDLWNPTI